MNTLVTEEKCIFLGEDSDQGQNPGIIGHVLKILGNTIDFCILFFFLSWATGLDQCSLRPKKIFCENNPKLLDFLKLDSFQET
jgi:hypothetical protein